MKRQRRLNFIRKETNHAEIAEIMLRVTLLSVKVKQAKEIQTSFVMPQAVKVTTTLLRCLVKMGKALKLYSKIFWERGGRGFTYIIFYYSVLL